MNTAVEAARAGLGKTGTWIRESSLPNGWNRCRDICCRNATFILSEDLAFSINIDVIFEISLKNSLDAPPFRCNFFEIDKAIG